MKNIEKRKILKLIIFLLCVVVFASAFLVLSRWLHSDGMHFIGSYGQVHILKMCEGIDQDGNKIESKNVVIDGVITKKRWESAVFEGEVNIIDGLPEGVLPAMISPVTEYDNGLYKLSWCSFIDVQISMREYDGEEREDRSCDGIAWIKDGEIAMKFYQGDDDTDGYYIYYSDVEMLEIEEIRTKLNENV